MRNLIIIFISLIIVSCGGGGGSSTPSPTPKINCKPPPAATNFSFGTKSFVCARFNENKGKHSEV